MDGGHVVADGTADQLKDQLGGNVLEVSVTNRSDLKRAVDLLAGLVSAAPRVDSELRRISGPINGGAKVLIAAGRALDDEGIDVEDLGIRRPSLDDVFLSLTGHTATSPTKDPLSPPGAVDD